jgi:hypothetical protein
MEDAPALQVVALPSADIDNARIRSFQTLSLSYIGVRERQPNGRIGLKLTAITAWDPEMLTVTKRAAP